MLVKKVSWKGWVGESGLGTKNWPLREVEIRVFEFRSFLQGLLEVVDHFLETNSALDSSPDAPRQKSADRRSW